MINRKETKWIVNIVVFIGLFFLFVVVHELSHTIIAILSGNSFVGIGLFYNSGNSSIIGIHVEIMITNIKSLLFIYISGILGSVITTFIFLHYSIKKERIGYTLVGFTNIIIEFFYWGLSPIIKHGDAYLLYQYLNLNLNACYLISLFSFIVAIIIAVFMFIIIDRMAVTKYTMYIPDKKYLERMKYEVKQKKT